MRRYNFAAMINALIDSELASTSEHDLLILLEDLRTMERTPEAAVAITRIVDQLMGEERMRARGPVVVH